MLFDDFCIQTVTINKNSVCYKPISPPNESTLEFVIPASSEVYRDLSCIRLKLRVKLNGTKKTSADGKTTERVACINNLLHSLFSQVQVLINGVNVTQNGDNYPYRAYIETIMSYGKDAVETLLTSSLFYLDTDKFLADDKNTGFVSRENAFNKNPIEISGRLHGDIFNIPQLLAPDIELRIKLTRSPTSFVLLSNDATSEMNFVIEDASLFVKSVTPSPEIATEHQKLLSLGETIKYNIQRCEVRTHVVSSGATSINIDNLILGTIPKMLIITFLDNAAYSGSVTTNPLYFDHFGYNSLELKVNSIPVPGDALTPDWANDRFADVYNLLFFESHIKHGRDANIITAEKFKQGYHLLVFDLTPDSKGTQNHISIPRQGNVRLESRFASALTSAVTVLSYAIYDSQIQIDQRGTVTINY